MSDQATMAAQPFPPGMSRLERLPDELKLRVGYYLMAPVAVKKAGEHLVVPTRTGIRYVYLLGGVPGRNLWNNPDELKVPENEHDYNDSVLALASTSNRLCDIFLVEHSKKYGLQNTLYRSIELGKINLVQRVVEYGADVNKTDTEAPWNVTALQLAVKSEQLPIILYLLRRGVDKVDELVMEVLRDREYHRRVYDQVIDLTWDPAGLKNHCRCNLLHVLMDATLGNSQTSHMSHIGSRLPRETLDALVPNGRHLWFILRTCMLGEWGCGCGDKGDGDCPQRLISLLRRYGAKWMPCGAYEDVPQPRPWSWMRMVVRDMGRTYPQRRGYGCGLADLRRFEEPVPNSNLYHDHDDPIVVKPSVAGAMHDNLLESAAYRRDHCIPFLVAMLEHGVAAEPGDVSHAMELASTPDTKQLSIAIVVALLSAGTNPNDPGVMKTAMRLACMEATKDAAVAFVTLLLEHGADPSAEELQDEIQGAAEKWWIQSGWQSSDIFCRILRLLVDGGLDERVAWEIFAVLGLGHDLVAEGGGGATKV
ncbi:hypothetical protein SLS63_008485 [Diaporthe eres]|uniref:Ankyrin repeat protein n=1 Tax=Diaporthe eres TaxID=83184 RepID=A0ABR1P2M8_DIAER